jgi:Mg-chelatase subunit ChlD
MNSTRINAAILVALGLVSLTVACSKNESQRAGASLDGPTDNKEGRGSSSGSPAVATPLPAEPIVTMPSAAAPGKPAALTGRSAGSAVAVAPPSVKPSDVDGVKGKSGRRDEAPALKREADGEGARASAEMLSAPGVKAGEWDDNANYRDFSKWLTSQGFAGARHTDTSERKFIVVQDKAGKGIPGCTIEVSEGYGNGGKTAALVTLSSGRALMFPHMLGIDARKVKLVAKCPEGEAKSEISMDIAPEVIRMSIAQPRRELSKRTIDVAFVLDTTGSMAEEIAAVKATIGKVAAALSNGQTKVRLGLVEYKDRGDSNVTRTYAFTSDANAFSKTISGLSAAGGGDTPEDLNAGLRTALSDLQWSQESVAKVAFVIADAPPHLDYANDTADYVVSMKQAASRGIKLHTVSASGMDAMGQVVFRQMAQYTAGTNMFVTRGGAGPQSVGGGDPGSACGGTHDNYASGNLDELIVKKVQRELSLLEMDPMRIAGVGEDESAKPCEKRFAWNQ